jgi:hypothetical protein
VTNGTWSNRMKTKIVQFVTACVLFAGLPGLRKCFCKHAGDALIAWGGEAARTLVYPETIEAVLFEAPITSAKLEAHANDWVKLRARIARLPPGCLVDLEAGH